MPPKGPGLGDQRIEGMERPAFNIETLHARNSFAKAVTPEYHGLLIEDYADITEQMIDYVTPERLETSLLTANRSSANTVYYKNPESRQSQWVAVTPLEARQLSGNIETLGNRAMSSVMASRSQRYDFDIDQDAARRGGVHAVTGQLHKLRTYKQYTLQQQVANIHWLQHAANNPGKAWKQGFDMRILIQTVRSGVFQDMQIAAREAEGWSPEKAAGIDKVLEWQLFFDRSHNNHIENWKAYLGLADTYLGYKMAMYGDKIAKAEKFITKHEQPVQ